MGETAAAVAKAGSQRDNRILPNQKQEIARTADSPHDRIKLLQRTIGNQALQRLLKTGSVQATLRIGSAGDICEKEAERISEHIMRMPETAVARKSS